jgi:hypothetical protein
VLRLPEDGNRYELLHGELIVNPAPTRQHQSVAAAVERWSPGGERPEILRDILPWLPPGRVETLAVDLQAIFERAIGPVG